MTILQKLEETNDSTFSDHQDLLLPVCDTQFDSQTLSDVSFGGPAVFAKLEALATEPDPSTVLQKLCASYDIVELADSEPAMFEVGLGHILGSAVNAPHTSESTFQRAFEIITSTIDGRTSYLGITLKHLLKEHFRPKHIDLSGMIPSQ